MSFNLIKFITSLFKKNSCVTVKPTEKKGVYKVDLPRKKFSYQSLKVVKRLQEQGYEAYLIGGAVRDTLFGGQPKDFDVATNATPDQIKNTFKNCRIIGKRFLLAHVFFREEIIEVATFRRSEKKSAESKTKILGYDNQFGSLKDDVYRRDFSLNALYYNPTNNTIVDLVGGLDDLQKHQLRVIGKPSQRFLEDPVRMIRAARYAAKLDLKIEQEAKEVICQKGSLLLHVPRARLLEELYKSFFHQESFKVLKLMVHLDLARYLIPRELLKPSLIKKIGQICTELSKKNYDRQLANYFLFLPFYLAFESLHPKKKQSRVASYFFEKFMYLVLVPKQFEQNFKKLLSLAVSGEKIPSSLREYQCVIKAYHQYQRWF